ncbi:MAG: transcription antitermination factor NusB [Actinomycetota bacterium]|nr:transcription antitermination factor NusB [Actinomycetota bacterium]
MPNSQGGENTERTLVPEEGDDNSQDWVVPIGSRREGRERVISLLYEMEVKSCSASTLLQELTLKPDPFVAERLLGITDNQVLLNSEIRKLSGDWEPSRMPLLDHAILQLGMFELIFRPEVPTGVILSEAVELAQKFSTESSGKFINGLLSAAAKQLRQTE